MRSKPWATVFEWFSDQTGMPFSSKYPPPTGSFTFINPKDLKTGKPREYTRAEIFDILNEILLAQYKHTLIRLDSTLTMVPADGKFDGSWFRRVTLEELKECARTEIVEVVVNLGGGYTAEEFAPDAKRLLGDFAKVTPLPVANQLIIRADVASIRRFLATIVPKDGEHGARTLTHKCIYVRASKAEAVISKALGGAAEIVKAAGNSTRERSLRSLTVTSDDETNMVFLTGPADKIDAAKAILTQLDTPRFKGDKGILVGPAAFKTHEVKSGSADALARMMAEMYKNNSQVRISAGPPNKLLVHADPQTQLEIHEMLVEAPVETQSAVIGLNVLDAASFIDVLKAMIPGAKNNAPYLGADANSNSIRVRGTAEQIKEVRRIIEAMDDLSALSVSRSVIHLDKSSGATVAEALEMLLPSLRGNPIKVVLPGRLGASPKSRRCRCRGRNRPPPPRTDLSSCRCA